MINYTERLDKAVRTSAWAHQHNQNEAKRFRKGTDIPYFIHPFGVMMIASNVTGVEDILIACLFHDILEDVDSNTYSETRMRTDFGGRVVSIVRDVTKNDAETDWRSRSEAYLHHLGNVACDEAVIVSAADKIHNLVSILADYKMYGDMLWNRFSTKSGADQLWWYESILGVITERQAPRPLTNQLAESVAQLRSIA